MKNLVSVGDMPCSSAPSPVPDATGLHPLADPALLIRELRALYGAPFAGPSRLALSEPGYLAIDPLERSIRMLAPAISGELLDVGCGSQPYRALFAPNCAITTCDRMPCGTNMDLVCEAHAIPRPDASFDAILCTEVLEHVPSAEAAIAELARLLRPDGKLIVSVPLYWPPHEQPHDYRRFTADGLLALVEGAGFEPERLLPRGGQWALLGQVAQHAGLKHLQRFGLIGPWNRVFHALDKARCSPGLTLGWTLLARRTLSPPSSIRP